MSRSTNSEAKACPDLVERFGALRPDERWMTAPRGEVAERADASIRQAARPGSISPNRCVPARCQRLDGC